MTTLDGWRAKVDAASLATVLEDGITVEPLYVHAPAAPSARGHATAPIVGHEYTVGEAAGAGQAIATDRRFGLAHAWVRLDASSRGRARPPADARPGTVVRSAADARALLDAAGDDVVLLLDAGSDGARVHALLHEAGADAAHARVLLDPLGAATELGGLGLALGEAIAELGPTLAAAPELAELLASGVPYHDAGATPAVEIAATIATAVTYVRAAVEHGLPIDRATTRLVLRIAVDSDVFASIAKLRATRWLWRGVARRFGATAEPRFSVRTALRNRTRIDPWVNLLRSTVETFAATTGSADEIVVGAFDEAIGRPRDDARRWAILGQHILREESRLSAVDDPAAGSGYVESLTGDLAARAWTIVREIEAAGGMPVALERGIVQTRVREAAHQRRQLLARGRVALVGVSLYPDLDEPRLEPPPDPRPAIPDAPAAVAQIGRLPPSRLAEPFEALRDASDAHLRRTGARPLALLVALGPGAEHRARVDFARMAVTVGGFATKLVDVQNLEAAPLAVVCGADASVADEIASVAAALRTAGIRHVLVAAPPGAVPSAAEHVDGFLHRGTEILSTMSDLHALLEVGG